MKLGDDNNCTLENCLMAFMSALLSCIPGHLSINLDSLIDLLFKRSGGFFETPSELVYLINVKGLSKSNRIKLNKLIDGLNKMGLAKDGKPVRVQTRDRAGP